MVLIPDAAALSRRAARAAFKYCETFMARSTHPSALATISAAILLALAFEAAGDPFFGGIPDETPFCAAIRAEAKKQQARGRSVDAPGNGEDACNAYTHDRMPELMLWLTRNRVDGLAGECSLLDQPGPLAEWCQRAVTAKRP